MCADRAKLLSPEMKVAIHIFRDVLVQPILIDGKTTYTPPREEHLEAEVELVEEEFDDYSQVINYDLSPETFDPARFAKANARALIKAINFGADMFGLKVQSPFNVDQIVGIVVVLEDKIALDIGGRKCFSHLHSTPVNLLLLGVTGHPHVCICTKREDETYREYAKRHAAGELADQLSCSSWAESGDMVI